MSLAAKLFGGADARKALRDLERKAARKALRDAVGDCTKIVLAEAKQRVPVDTGTLKKALGRKQKSYGAGKAVVGLVGARSDKTRVDPGRGKAKFRRLAVRKRYVTAKTVNASRYVHLVEYGARPHALGKGSSLKKGKASGRVHPGSPPRPFLRPAWEASRSRCKAAFDYRVKTGLRLAGVK